MSTAAGLLKQDFATLGDLIHAHAVERPTAVALVNGARSLDYAQLDQLMDRAAASLQREGLNAGDIIAVSGHYTHLCDTTGLRLTL